MLRIKGNNSDLLYIKKVNINKVILSINFNNSII